MGTESDSHNVKSRGTSTHQAEGAAKEVVVVTVPSTEIGSNRSAPPNPYDFDFGHEIRATYFHDGKRTGVQLPRWSNEYSSIEYKGPLTDIVATENRVVAVYRLDDDEASTVTWDVEQDTWEEETQEVDSYEDFIAGLGEVVWSTVRDREPALT